MGKPSGSIAVAVMGLGAIGRRIAQAAASSPKLELVAAIDASPALAGRPLCELVPEAPAGVRVQADQAKALAGLRGAVLLHATGSSFLQVLPQLECAARAGVHLVSTCEELAFPWLRHEKEADALDRLAQEKGASLLGTGINPGFVLDRLVATAGAVVGPVRKVRAERVVDVRKRREALQRKVGVGLSEEAFEAQVEAGTLGHVGLAESAALCALGLGLDFDEFEEEIGPVLAEERLAGEPAVEKGRVAGLHQSVRGFAEGVKVVELDLTIALGVEASYDLVEIEATPPVRLKVEGGYAGDEATAWAVVNAASRVAAAEPGILTVLELPAGR